MLTGTLFQAVTLASLVLASPAVERRGCTAQQRLAGAQLIVTSYNAVLPGESAAGFAQLPLTDDCHTYINPNGGPPVVVAIDALTTKAFALNARQVFSEVTGHFIDYPDNATTVIQTNVTLGALHVAAIPVTFYANVFLFYDPGSCLMEVIQAFATIPTVIDGILIEPPILPMLLNASVLDPKPTA